VTERVSPLPGQVYQVVQTFTEYDAETERYATTDLTEAQVITSLIAGETEKHKLVLDIDLPAQLIPSTTEGHFHLYVDTVIEERKWEALLIALAEAGVIEPGYMRASIARGFTAVRLPWIKKTIEENPE
jgi:hypothetical protein